MERQKRKPSFFRILLRLILVLLLLALILAGAAVAWLALGMKQTEIAVDDISALLAAEPMDAADRFGLDEEGRLTVKLDKVDLLWMVEKLCGPGWQDEIAAAAAQNGVTLDGLGLRITEAGASLEARALWKKATLTAVMPLEVSCENGELRVSASEVEVAGLPVPLSKIAEYIPFDPDSLKLTYRPEAVFTEGVEAVTLADDALYLHGRLTPEILEGLPSMPRMRTLRYHLFMDGAGPAMEAQELYESDPGAALSPLKERMRKDPSAFPAFVRSLFLMMEDGAFAKLAPAEKNDGFLLRWLPDVDGLRAAHAALDEQYKSRAAQLGDFQDALKGAWHSGAFTVRDGQILYNGEAFSADAFLAALGTDSGILFEAGSAVPCLLDMTGYEDKFAPVLSKIADGMNSFSRPMDLDRRYPFGVLVRGKDGGAYLLCVTVSSSLVGGWPVDTENYNVLPVSGEAYAAAASGQVVPVFSR